MPVLPPSAGEEIEPLSGGAAGQQRAGKNEMARITPEELDYIRIAAIGDMLGDSRAFDEQHGTGTPDDETGRFRHEHWRRESAGNPAVPWRPACEPSVGQGTQNLALVTARRYNGDRHITC